MLGHPTALMEAAVAVVFLITWLHASRRGRSYQRELLSAVLFGLLLEEGDILIFGSYYYSSDFVLAIDRVPISIALSWAVIIYSCMHLSDAYGINPRLAPFADAIWAIALDFAFDAVAIRMGLWHWDISLDEGYFGVPAGNFYAWLLVALTFSAGARWLRSHALARWQIALPLAAYAGLIVGLAPYILLKAAFFPGDGDGLPIFVAVALAFAAVAAYSFFKRQPRFPEWQDWWPVLARLSFHVYFLGAIFVHGMQSQTPALPAAAFGMLAFEIMLAAQLAWPLISGHGVRAPKWTEAPIVGSN